MRIHWIKNNPNSTSIGLAEILPEEDEKLANQNAELRDLHPKKKLEFFASRRLMQHMCEELGVAFNGIKKDEFGKPHLIESSHHVSISHSYPYVVCAVNPKTSCGIDIESVRPQLLKIRHKFLNQDELDYCGEDLQRLCLHWSAKEALYKLFGRKRLLFAEQMAVNSISDQKMEGQIMVEGNVDNYPLKYEYFLEYLIVYSA